MISPSEAHRLILHNAKLLSIETIPLTKAVGRVLRENITSDRDQPPFNKSLVDGIAIAFDTWQKGQRAFNIEAIIPPGIAPKPLKNLSSCVRIMTGAVIPKGCDCVIPVEQIHLEGDTAQSKDWTMIKKHQFIRHQAADGKKGEILLKAGCRLWAPHIGIAASVGKIKIKVSVLPKIAVISTGDELVDIQKPIKQYQTRLSNSYALQALLTQAQLGDVQIFHLKDNQKQMLQSIKSILGKFDILILSGGVSMGEFDYVPKVLTKLGIKQSFHKVSQKPGKPFWFGIAKGTKAVFALPGNPVSTQICAYRYIIPYLKKSSGLEVKQEFIPVLDRVNIQSDLTHFLPVSQGRLVTISGSGDFASLAQADGFIEYESHKPQDLGLILAGGYSQRMGRDKAYLKFHAKPQVEHIFDLLGKYCEKIFLSKRKDQKPYKHIEFINDAPAFENHGPLGGILSAIKEYPDAAWLVIACDLPFVTDETIETLLAHRDPQKPATAFISTHDALPEPLCAIWEGHAYQSILKLFNEGTHCPRKILIKSDTHLLKQKNPHWLDNVNTPQEYEQTKALHFDLTP